MSSSERVLCGGDWQNARPLRPFAPEVVEFLAELSAALLRDPAARPYPDIVTFAFFIRRANLTRLEQEYPDAAQRLGRGMVFHIAPSNVPINFAYSLAAGLLAGNACVVKASSRDFPQTRIVCAVMNQVMEQHPAMAPYVTVLLYPREEQARTETLSAACDGRIIWGGDETIRRVRQAPLPLHGVEIAFADRYSLLVIAAQAVLDMSDEALRRVAQDFYNDTFLTDQNACTAPRLVYWLGNEETVRQAQRRFWQAIHDYAKGRYPVEPVVAVDKLTALCRAAIGLEAERQPMPDNRIVRAALPRLTEDVDEYRCHGGFFLEYAAETLDDLIPVVKRKYQTLSCLGLEPAALRQFVLDNGLPGIDRITPLGHTMDFDLIWDGYDLIRTLSRRIAAY